MARSTTPTCLEFSQSLIGFSEHSLREKMNHKFLVLTTLIYNILYKYNIFAQVAHQDPCQHIERDEILCKIIREFCRPKSRGRLVCYTSNSYAKGSLACFTSH